MRHRTLPYFGLMIAALSGCNGGGTDKVQVDTGPWDDDGDGIYARDDCDDSQAMIGAAETWYEDYDGDGHGNADISEDACNQPSGYVDSSDDCDDTTEFISPIASERCDNVDNDCDGEIDEDDARDAVTYYPDTDNDDYGDESAPVTKCSQPRGYVEDGTDCNDGDEDIHPGACEVCGDDIDNDCDGVEVCDSLSQAALILRGEGAGDKAGTQARGGMDLNGDGFVDLVVSAPGAGDDAGRVYEVRGPLLGEVGLEDTWTAVDGSSGAELGVGLASLGDVDGDGYDDVLAGAPGAGQAWLLSGPDLATASVISGEEAGDEAGHAVSRLGDFDGDGEDDYVVGAPASSGGTDAGGAVYVVYGPLGDTASLYDAPAIWYGDSDGQRAGDALSGLGDFDGDGYEDFIFGADGLGSTSLTVGAVYVVYGPQEGIFGSEDVDVKWFGEATGEAAAYPARVGDVSGDGLDDVAIAVPGKEISGEPQSGVLYFWFGNRYTAIDNVDRGDASLIGEADRDFLFVPLGGADGGYGDMDADGYDDILVSALGSDYAATDAGASYLMYGPLSGELSLCESDVHYYGEAENNFAGSSTVGAGDFDDDGTPDLLLGAPGYDSSSGSAYVILGGSWSSE